MKRNTYLSVDKTFTTLREFTKQNNLTHQERKLVFSLAIGQALSMGHCGSIEVKRVSAKDYNNHFRFGGTYVIWDENKKDLLRWKAKGTKKPIYFAGFEDAKSTALAGERVISAKQLQKISPTHFEEYKKRINECFESGELE